MAVTQADIDTLESAVNSGILEVRYDGPPARLLKYQTLADMRARLAEMKAEIARAQGTRVSYRLVATRKGL